MSTLNYATMNHCGKSTWDITIAILLLVSAHHHLSTIANCANQPSMTSNWRYVRPVSSWNIAVLTVKRIIGSSIKKHARSRRLKYKMIVYLLSIRSALLANALSLSLSLSLCYLPLPLDENIRRINSCCSKRICVGCVHANQKRETEQGLEQKCPTVESLCRRQMKKSIIIIWKELRRMTVGRQNIIGSTFITVLPYQKLLQNSTSLVASVYTNNGLFKVWCFYGKLSCQNWQDLVH
jgi:hypothetical protein